MKHSTAFIAALCIITLTPHLFAADPAQRDTSRGDRMIARYFAAKTHELADRCLSDIDSQADWDAVKGELRSQLFEMLGLDPMPERTPLKPVIAATTEHDEFVVERLHFQSKPGLYVTGNLYRPKVQDEKLPAILYVCGHGRVKKGDVSFGNKAHYQHHGAWFAQNGYVCLTIDTLQLGEIEGIHHGTYSHGRWWWNSRGYSSAGVEAWNCIRALDYLQTRDEVDGDRIGVTGRSGGGAYSWWIAALDERIKAAVPVAGITNLKNHVIDGCVEGHCDCMYMVNTYGWDYAQVAALVAPRPLLISNTDKDRIFPLDGVVDIYSKVRRIYELHGQLKHIGLQITEGPHKDTQELRVHAFHWFNKFLKGEDPLIETAAVKLFEPEQLQVFPTLPSDELNTSIDETFTRKASLPAASDVTNVSEAADKLRQTLRDKCFRGWPQDESILDAVSPKKQFEAEFDGIVLTAFEFSPERHIDLTLFTVRAAKTAPERLSLNVLNVMDDDGWADFLATMRVGFARNFVHEIESEIDQDGWKQLAQMLKSNPWGMAYVFPRGIGPTAWDQSDRKQTQHRRRFMLLGQTQDSMRLWDTRAAIRALQAANGMQDVPVWLQANGTMAGIALYAGLFDGDALARLDLYELSPSHRNGPTFLNVLRVTDVPYTAALAAANCRIVLYDTQTDFWELPLALSTRSEKAKKQFQIRHLK